MNKSRLVFFFTLLFSLSLVSILVIPRLEKGFFPASHQPGLFTFAGVGLIIVLLTGFVIYIAVRADTRLPKISLVLLFLYNLLVVFVKFSLGPNAAYEGQWVSRSKISGDIFFWLPAAVLILIIYLAVFAGLYLVIRRKALNVLKGKLDSSPLWKRITQGIAVTIGVSALAIGGLVVMGVALVFSTGFEVSPADYFIRVLFANTVAIPVLISLSLAIILAFMSLDSVGQQAIVIRDISILASFFWIGLVFLLLYHALWVVYILVLTTVWPLKVVLPTPFK